MSCEPTDSPFDVELDSREKLTRMLIILDGEASHTLVDNYFLVPFKPYQPAFLSTAMMTGQRSIRTHLVLAHGFTAGRVDRMRDENCYRVHDQLHHLKGD